MVVCHNGKVFVYGSSMQISAKYVELTVMSYKNKHYNDYDAQIMAIKELKHKFSGKIFMEEMV